MEPPGRIHLPGLDRSLPPRGLRETLRETIGSTYDQQLRLALKQQLIGPSRCMERGSGWRSRADFVRQGRRGIRSGDLAQCLPRASRSVRGTELEDRLLHGREEQRYGSGPLLPDADPLEPGPRAESRHAAGCLAARKDTSVFRDGRAVARARRLTNFREPLTGWRRTPSRPARRRGRPVGSRRRRTRPPRACRDLPSRRRI
jgi:hypothetical protein